jgi:hypothetical protein
MSTRIKRLSFEMWYGRRILENYDYRKESSEKGVVNFTYNFTV